MKILLASILFPILSLGGSCCIAPTPLGAVDCADMKTGITEAYYTCPSNVSAIGYLPDAGGINAKSEINAFGLAGTNPENLLQPINFLKLDDDTGAVHEWENGTANGNKTLTHTFKFKVVPTTPTEEAALIQMNGREVVLVTKNRNKVWRMINQQGGMVMTTETGNSNQTFVEVTITGKVEERPLRISFTDAGAWANANLIPASLGGLINA